MVFWCNQSHGKRVFYSLPESFSICCWDLGSACLSQHAWKLAGEEGLACANYILIIGNVLANQASIAILEHVAPLCRLRTEACSIRVWKCGWDQTSSWMHSTTAWYGSMPGLHAGNRQSRHYSQRWETAPWGSVAHLFSNFASRTGERWRAQGSATRHELWTPPCKWAGSGSRRTWLPTQLIQKTHTHTYTHKLK